MKVLIDSNVILDVLLNRSSFYTNSRKVFELAEKKQVAGHISASAMTDIFYITRKELKDNESVYKAIEILVALFIIIPVTETTIAKAVALRWQDFEDAVQYTAAQENGITCIVTRDEADYKTAGIQCMSPFEFVAHAQLLQNTGL